MKKVYLPLALALAAAPLFAASSAHAAGVDDYLQLSWDGSTFTNTTEESFVGSNKVVPGDAKSRTLTVKNNSPETAVLTGWLLGETLPTIVKDLCPGREGSNLDWMGSTATCPTPGDQGNFYDDLTAQWSGTLGEGTTNFTTLAAKREVAIGQKTLAPGETVTVNAGFAFPEAATSGNWANANDRKAEFDLLFELKGDTAPTPTPTPTTTSPVPTTTTTPPAPRPTTTVTVPTPTVTVPTPTVTVPTPTVTVTTPGKPTPTNKPVPPVTERVSRNTTRYVTVGGVTGKKNPVVQDTKTCAELGKNIQATDPRYTVALDGDRDGVACEASAFTSGSIDSGALKQAVNPWTAGAAALLMGGGLLLLLKRRRSQDEAEPTNKL